MEIFDRAADCLEEMTQLTRLEARGTLRIALKQAGLDVKGLRLTQLNVVAEKLLPGLLQERGEDDSETVCRRLMERMAEAGDSGGGENVAESIDSVFGSLGR